MKIQWLSKVVSAIMIVMLALAAIPVTPARAASITVNITTDENTPAGTNCSLREAIIAANTDAAYNDCAAGTGADVITLTSGQTYVLSLAGTDDNSAAGDLDVTDTGADTLTINTSGAGTATIDSNDIDRIFDVRPNATLILNNITVTDATATTAAGGVGGGLRVTGGGTASITNGSFTNNQTQLGAGGTQTGGAIYVNGSTLNLTGVTFTSNASDENGGGIFVDGASTVTISGSTFQTHNAAEIDNGAAIFVNAGTVNINGSTFTNNDTDNGGAIGQAGGTINLGTTSANSFTLNDATNGSGGAIYRTGGTLTIGAGGINNTFTMNTATGDGGAIYNSFGNLTITSATFTGNSTNNDGGAIYYNANGSTLTVNLTSFSDQNNANIDDGGAIYINDGGMTLNGSTFTNNDADNGGAIYLAAGADSINVGTTTANSFSNNDANLAGGDGGAIYKTGGTLLIGAAGINNTFTTNTASGTGGALYADADGDFDIIGATFTSNSSAAEGGAIDNDGETTATITSSTFSSNASTANRGGAISNHNGSVITINTSTFTSNTANGNGGGGAINNSSTMTITNSTFNSNNVNGTATLDGGAILNANTLTIQNSTFFGNQTNTGAGSVGGAIHGLAGTLNVSFVSFSDNRASAGNGSDIHITAGALNLFRSYLVNPDTTAVNCYSPVADTVTNSLIENNAAGANACGTAPSTAFNFTLSLANNGGTTQTLAVTSPMTGIVNAATACTNASNAAVATDQRGTARPQPAGGNCDLGAFELQNQAPTNITLSNNTIDENLPAGTLIGTLSSTDADDVTFTYSLVSTGACAGPNNASFQIAGASNNELQNTAVFDFETTASYTICIRTTDTANNTFDKQFTINVNDISETPSVTTQPVTSIGSTTATGNGTITSLGITNPTAHGVVWNTTGTPTLADNFTDEGAAAATGPFTSSITGLVANTTYYVRAYATNSIGTSYGNEVTFVTTNAPLFTSADNTSFDLGTAGLFNITATGNPQTMTISLTGTLPNGVTFTDNGNGTATFSGTPASGSAGTYPLILTANNGVTPNGIQNFTLTVRNGPLATIINSTPDTGNGSISENEAISTDLGVTQITVEFSRDVYDDPTDTTSFDDDVTNPANYILVRSTTGTFATTGCSTGVQVPDVKVNVNSVTYTTSGGKFIATLSINDGLPLNVEGFYKLFVCGTTSIVDATNLTLSLAGDGVNPGTDFVRNFRIAAPASSGGGSSNDDDDSGGNARNRAVVTTINQGGLLIPVTGFAPQRVTQLPAQNTSYAASKLTLEIPSISLKMPIVGVEFKSNTWDVTWLGNNTGYLEGSAYPTMNGNTVLTGHVTDPNGKPGPFAHLTDLQLGQKIYIHNDGFIYVYDIRQTNLIKPSAIKTLFQHEDDSWLSIVTCENFDAKTGKFIERRLVRAVLISIIPAK